MLAGKITALLRFAVMRIGSMNAKGDRARGHPVNSR